jgi:PIN domain nuclease of toxin-antitoxin system
VASRENDVALSVASVWECVIKHTLGKLHLPEAPALYVPRQRSRHGFASLPILEEDIPRLAQLPALHKDPFDRILIAQAQEHGLVLVTADQLITQYPVTSLDWA